MSPSPEVCAAQLDRPLGVWQSKRCILRIPMPTLTEAVFRAHLNASGLYLGEATLDPATAFMVFSQASDARIEADAWEKKAATFLQMRFGLVVPKVYDVEYPNTDAALVVIAASEGEGRLRLIQCRPAVQADLERATAGERLGAVGGGLVDLAMRCPSVWFVEAIGDDDRMALAIATVIAMTHLGPIVPPQGDTLFGVRTARTKLGSH